MGDLSTGATNPLSGASTDIRLYRMWCCTLHDRCFSAEHLTIDQVAEQAAECPVKCKCWRHAVIKVADRYGIRPAKMQKQPTHG